MGRWDGKGHSDGMEEGVRGKILESVDDEVEMRDVIDVGEMS